MDGFEVVYPSPGRLRGHTTAVEDGRPYAVGPHTDGLVDVDLRASACTNTLPVHRLGMPVGAVTPAPAAYVRALDVSVTRLEQTYRNRGDLTFDYTSGDGAFTAVLVHDEAGPVLGYPGIATRFP